MQLLSDSVLNWLASESRYGIVNKELTQLFEGSLVGVLSQPGYFLFPHEVTALNDLCVSNKV